MNHILIIDEEHHIDAARLKQLASRVDALSIDGVHIIDHKTTEGDLVMGSSNRSLVISELAAGLAGIGNPTFGASFAMLYGNNPKSLNGQSRCNSSVARDKRAKAKRRNVRKHPRSAHKYGGNRYSRKNRA